MIDPQNVRLKRFHILVCLSLYLDFILTCFIVGNHYYVKGQQPDFMHAQSLFVYLIIILILDILLNFLKKKIIDIVM